MFSWRKLGRIFNPADVKGKFWLNEYSQAPATLIFDNYVRVYFSCRSKRDKLGQIVSYSAYVDLDRKNLFNILNIAQEPVLKLGKRGCFDEFGTFSMSVIKKNNEVWGYYAGMTRCESVPFNTAIGVGISRNGGVKFDKLGDGPILSYSPDEPFIISGPKIRNFKDHNYLFYICGRKWLLVNGNPEMLVKIRMAKSTDGLTWVKNNRNLISDKIDNNECQASPDVFYKNRKYHMFFCYWNPTTFRESKSRKIGYAYSDDLINWTRNDFKAGIDVSEEGWDSEMLAYPHVFELDGKIYMLYLGNEVGRYGFGLAELVGELK